MINRSQITLGWIENASKKNQKTDKILIEKVIRALLLLEGLAKQDLPFVFKGGTALMLHFNSSKRLSIDIDIIIPDKPVNLENALDFVVEEQGFLRKKLQERTTISNIEKEHYQFYYTPIHQSNLTEDYILLDILFEKINYSHLKNLPIQSHFLPVQGKPFMVKVPGMEDILGDKLTAFAPNTTGIPYYRDKKSMSMEIIKQLYDIGGLVDVVQDVNIIRATFIRFAETELKYRNHSDYTPGIVLDDIYQTSLCIATRGQDGTGNFEELQKGIQRIKNYIFSESYYIDKVIIHASKAAYIATIIKCNVNEFEKYDSPGIMQSWFIQEPLNPKLNKLKKSNPEAFFYWYKIYELVKD